MNIKNSGIAKISRTPFASRPSPDGAVDPKVQAGWTRPDGARGKRPQQHAANLGAAGRQPARPFPRQGLHHVNAGLQRGAVPMPGRHLRAIAGLPPGSPRRNIQPPMTTVLGLPMPRSEYNDLVGGVNAYHRGFKGGINAVLSGMTFGVYSAFRLLIGKSPV